MNAKDRKALSQIPSDEIEHRRKRKQQRKLEVATLQSVAMNDPATLLHIATVSAAIGLGSTAIYDRIRAGTFPEPVRLSARCSRWRSRDVFAWLNAQSAERPCGSQSRVSSDDARSAS